MRWDGTTEGGGGMVGNMGSKQGWVYWNLDTYLRDVKQKEGGVRKAYFSLFKLRSISFTSLWSPCIYAPPLFLFPVLSPLTRDEITDYKNSTRGNFFVIKI